MKGFTEEQEKLLDEPLLRENVKTRDGTGKTQLSYLASFHVIAEANRIFGFGGWDTEILSLTQTDKTEYEKPPYKPNDKPKQMVSISYLCKLRIAIKAGDSLVVREDVGFGNGVAGATAYGIGSCIELASKEAVTDALKRCMRYFGDQFGLSLYDKEVILIDSDQFEMSKPVTEDQLKELRDLYIDRDIDDEWVLIALKAENYPNETMEEMKNDWFELIISIVKKYKAEEIEKANYAVDIENVIKLMEESANMNMLKALFKEFWTKASKQDDKERMKSGQAIYEKMKKGFE